MHWLGLLRTRFFPVAFQGRPWLWLAAPSRPQRGGRGLVRPAQHQVNEGEGGKGGAGEIFFKVLNPHPHNAFVFKPFFCPYHFPSNLPFCLLRSPDSLFMFLSFQVILLNSLLGHRMPYDNAAHLSFYWTTKYAVTSLTEGFRMEVHLKKQLWVKM